eukprot:scaffold27806_cov65-Phaeocystis_antarctica.AAC.1
MLATTVAARRTGPCTTSGAGKRRRACRDAGGGGPSTGPPSGACTWPPLPYRSATWAREREAEVEGRAPLAYA